MWISIALLWVLGMPLVADALMRRLETPYHRIPVEQIQQADAIVVLSGMLSQMDGAPLGEWGEAVDRFEGGIELFRAGKAPLLVFTAGQMPWKQHLRPEGVILAERARRMGVPKGRIRLTSIVANTAQEAVASAELLGVSRSEPKRIILVTSAFHMQRAAMVFRSAGFDVVPYPVDFRATDLNRRVTILDFMPDAGGLNDSSMVLRELIGRLVYLNGASFLSSRK